jgi:hypothetical protein
MRQQRISAGSAKKAVSQKISRAQKVSLFAFSKLDYGVYARGLYVVFRIGPVGEICFCFFNAACRAVSGPASYLLPIMVSLQVHRR